MNNSTKNPFTAAILNFLVIPGLGQFYLGFKKTGGIIILTTLIALSILLYRIMLIAKQLIEEVATGKLSNDIVELQSAVHLQLSNSQTPLFKSSLAILIALWIGSTLHCLAIKNRL